MALSALGDKSQVPTEGTLKDVLGPAMGLWDDFRSSLASKYSPLIEKWGFSGKQWGWSLALRYKKRAIVYLTPSETFFYAGFALGEKAVAVARESGLPSSVLSAIEAAPKYAEGRGVRLEIHTAQDVAHALVVSEAKMAT